MAISIFPVTQDFAAEIGDVDLAQPLAPEDRDAIKAAFWKYAVLVFPAQELTSDQHVAFAQVFGPMEPNINSYADEVKKDRIDDRVSDVSNLDEDNRDPAGGQPQAPLGTRQPPVAHRQHLPPRARAARRSSTRGASRRSAATPSSPTCAPRGTRCRRRPGAASTA